MIITILLVTVFVRLIGFQLLQWRHIQNIFEFVKRSSVKFDPPLCRIVMKNTRGRKSRDTCSLNIDFTYSFLHGHSTLRSDWKLHSLVYTNVVDGYLGFYRYYPHNRHSGSNKKKAAPAWENIVFFYIRGNTQKMRLYTFRCLW
jgi:hypothetical protein